MRSIGRKPIPIATLPSAQGLHEAVLQQDIGRAMAAFHSTGIAKGIFRFKTPQEADAHRLGALVRVIAANAARHRRGLRAATTTTTTTTTRPPPKRPVRRR